MKLFGRKKKKPQINQEFIKEHASEIHEEDVEKVVSNSKEIKAKMAKNKKFKRFLNDGKTMLSLLKDYWKKNYTETPWYAIASMVFTLLYVLNPLDLSPDYIPIVGYIDDVTVFSFALTLVNKDLVTYKKWKSEQIEKSSEKQT